MAAFPDLQTFERYVAEGNEDALKEFYARRRWSPILDDDVFATWALAAVRRCREHPRAQQTPQFPTLDAVVRATAPETAER